MYRSSLLPETLISAAEGTPSAAAFVADDVNAILALDAQVQQNLPVSGRPGQSQPFINSLAGAPVTACASLLDLARIESGFNPLVPGEGDNPAALNAYVEALLNQSSLFVARLHDEQTITRKDADWNQVINEVVALYPVPSEAQRDLIRASIVSLINLASAEGASGQLQLMSQHTVESQAEEINVYIYLSTVTFTTQKDGKDTTRQLHFQIYRTVLQFQTAEWNLAQAAALANRHYKSLQDWLAGMNTQASASHVPLACFVS